MFALADDSPPHRTRARAWLDAMLVVAAVLLCAVTLLYPYERDQALYHYIAREWLHGFVPYRDTLDHKPPWIFVAYVLAHLLGGNRAWGIRVVELVFLVAVGWRFGAALDPTRRHAGLRGLSAFVLSSSLLAAMPYWGMGEAETWVLGFVLLAFSDLYEPARARGLAVTARAGVLFGLALMAKPTAVLLAPALLPWCVAHGAVTSGATRRARLVHVGVWATALSAPWLFALAYFARHHALGDLYELLVEVNDYHRTQGKLHSLGEMARYCGAFARDYFALTVGGALAALVAAAAAHRRGARAERGVALTMVATCVVSFATVLVQNKFWHYHWGQLYLANGASFVVASTVLYRAIGPTRATLAAAAVFLALLGSMGPVYERYVRTVRATRGYLAHALSREQYLDEVSLGVPWYAPKMNERVAAWLRAHVAPREVVGNRTFEPVIYLDSNTRGASRFFWSPWIAWADHMFRRPDWLAQDRAMMRAAMPRYIVATTEGDPNSIESLWHYLPDYELAETFGRLVVLERVIGPNDAPQSLQFAPRTRDP